MGASETGTIEQYINIVYVYASIFPPPLTLIFDV
jgi:hypothetical protein